MTAKPKREQQMPDLAQVAEALHQVLTNIADQAAHETGCIQRQRTFTGATLIQTLVFGWLHQPQATLEQLSQMAATVGVLVTPQGLDKRFTEALARCLRQVLEAAVAQVITSNQVVIPLLNRFTGVLIQDSSVILLPADLATTWRGCGGADPTHGASALKIQVRLDLTTGQIQGPHLQDGRVHDLRAPEQTRQMKAGALRLADLGYFSLAHLQDLGEQGAYWLTRWRVGTVVRNEQGQALEVIPWLNEQGTSVIDCPVQLGVTAQLSARLIAVRVPPEVANERRRRLKADAQRRGQTLSKMRLAAADWTLYLTNVPMEMLTVEEVLVLGRARWQIELLFKRWKSHGVIDKSRSTRSWRILCELYAKLIAMVIQQWLLLTSCWQYPNRSLVKASQTVRSYAMVLANAFAGIAELAAVLTHLAQCLSAGCRMNSRKKEPNTYQLLFGYP